MFSQHFLVSLHTKYNYFARCAISLVLLLNRPSRGHWRSKYDMVVVVKVKVAQDIQSISQSWQQQQLLVYTFACNSFLSHSLSPACIYFARSWRWSWSWRRKKLLLSVSFSLSLWLQQSSIDAIDVVVQDEAHPPPVAAPRSTTSTSSTPAYKMRRRQEKISSLHGLARVKIPKTQHPVKGITTAIDGFWKVFPSKVERSFTWRWMERWMVPIATWLG